MSATALRNDIYNALDSVAETGEPLIVERKGKKLKVILEEETNDIFTKLKPHPGTVIGDPEELIYLKLDDWNPDTDLE